MHLPGGKICLFGYPETDFPPTDFHSATLIDDDIYVIGSLGYMNARRYGETPVYRLDTRSFRFERVDASGDAPGWIYQHRAGKVSAHEIRITGGKVVTCSGGAEQYRDNDTAYVFDTRANMWRIERVR
ncbi:MAG TPA: hypothetical protein VFR86_11935 [Burkholderiaceae bacterium]|nr:hypothetical protein [Burkholderiaceae bacterium]